MAIHRVIDFLTSNNVLVSPDIQSRPVHPFTMQHAQRFFGNFTKESFTFNGAVRAILIRDGKENLPGHSYASGFLFSQTLDEIEALGRLPNPIGSIQFEYGGNTTVPDIKLTRL